MIRHIVCLSLVACTTLAASGVMAQDLTPSRVTVTFADSDFKTREQAQKVYRKLYQVAQYVCESEGAGPQWREADDRACERQAMNDAVTDLNKPELNKVHTRMDADPERLARIMPVEENAR